MSDDLRERVAAAMWNSRGNGDWKDVTNTALVAIYRNLADAALAEMGAVSVREAALKAQIHRLTAAGDNLTAWADDRGTPDVRKWDKARDEAFRAINEIARAV